MSHLNTETKLYYSIGEVAEMLGVPETTLRYWESQMPQLVPRRAGRNIRQYTKEDVQTVRLIHHLVKERGMTVEGARKRLTKNKQIVSRNVEVIERLRNMREKLVAMRKALDGFTYQQVEDLKKNIVSSAPPIHG